ncbi:MAG TPA: Verru_Chthon cassette protein A, partial [Terrimicrobiaceae bacterium]|nr:Verru_Chthon cassette protein A [Terrimicrobiaceae bacterium]
SKYSFPGERDQILTEIFDYIRCTNLNETWSGQPANFEPYTKKLDAATGSTEAHTTNKLYAGAGFVLPIRIDDASRGIDTRGAGRVPVVSEAGFWVIQTYADEVRNASDVIIEPSKPFDPPRVQVALILETFSPMQGPMTWMPINFSVKLRNSSSGGPRIGTRNLFPDDQTESFSAGPLQSFAGGQGFGGPDGWAWLFASHNRSQSGDGLGGFPNSLGRNPPWAMKKSDAIELSAGATTVSITGGEIEVWLQCEPNNGSHLLTAQKVGQPYQKYTIKIPSVTLPVPPPVPFPPRPASLTKDDIVTAVARNGWYQRCSGGDPPAFFATDVVRGIELRDGDARIAAYCDDVPSGFFREHKDYASMANLAHGFRLTSGINTALLGTTNGGYINQTYGEGSSASPQPNFRTLHGPDISSRISSLLDEGWAGDFDNGLGSLPDGAYLNKSDEGGFAANSTTPPYFYHTWYPAVGLFSPLKQCPSAVIFGSLPTGVKETISAYSSVTPSGGKPWRTLNFCPNPLAGSSHLGLASPPDSLLLDLFTMPIVEPYAISEPLSTAGRLNMNYQMVPFTYIQRRTAMVAALSAQQIIAIDTTFADKYKDPRLTGLPAQFPDRQIRFPLNVDETLKQFDDRFSGLDIFRSATEICGLYLVPQGRTAANVQSWWSGYQLTGNNLRERPYATLYPLLTTKSNVFTTHMRVQAVKRTPAGKVQVNGEYRGSVTFERFLDPNNPKFTDGSVDSDNVSLEPYFRFRTLSAKQFDL